MPGHVGAGDRSAESAGIAVERCRAQAVANGPFDQHREVGQYLGRAETGPDLLHVPAHHLGGDPTGRGEFPA
jgi:hypothetical protein